MRGLFLDADEELAAIYHAVRRPGDPELTLNFAKDLTPDALPALLAEHDYLLDDHTNLPTDAMAACPKTKDIIFLGTGARSYMDLDALAGLGIHVHTIKGYGDTAVAEHAFALMWAAARSIAQMDGAIRQGRWLGTTGMQLTGKTLGLIGYGGVAAELARLAAGAGMRVLAWNRTPRHADAANFVPLDELLSESHVLSLHLLLTEETRGFLNRTRLAQLRPGAILVNTARGAVVDEDAMIDALNSRALRHAALDVFDTEPLPPDHPLTKLDNVTLSAHSAFRTPEAGEVLIRKALDIACQIAKRG